MKTRLECVQNQLISWKIDALLIENKIDLLYLTGLSLSAGKLLVTPTVSTLLVDGRYYEMARIEYAPVILENEEAFKALLSPFTTVGFDGSTLSWERVQQLMDQYPHLHWQSIPQPLNPFRAIKDSEEIKKMKKAAELGSRGFDLLKTLLKEGVEERELALKLELFWKEQGGKEVAFEPIIAFGENSAHPHYHGGKGRLKKGDVVLLDIGVVLENYHSDMTRTLFFGPPSSKMREVYEVVREAQKKAINAIQPGKTAGEIDQIARSLIEEKGYGKAFTHSLGHGVGLQIHEWPYLKNKEPYAAVPLVENMCVTVEPGIYLPGIGGIRIEDTVVVTSEGTLSLTQRPTELEVIDA